MTHNLWHMGDFTHSSGTHLDSWDNYNKWEMQNGTQRKTKPRWYEALEQETLIDPTAGSNRTLIKDYRYSTREIDTLRPFVPTRRTRSLLQFIVPTAPTKSRFGSQPTMLNGKGYIGSSN